MTSLRFDGYFLWNVKTISFHKIAGVWALALAIAPACKSGEGHAPDRDIAPPPRQEVAAPPSAPETVPESVPLKDVSRAVEFATRDIRDAHNAATRPFEAARDRMRELTSAVGSAVGVAFQTSAYRMIHKLGPPTSADLARARKVAREGRANVDPAGDWTFGANGVRLFTTTLDSAALACTKGQETRLLTRGRKNGGWVIYDWWSFEGPTQRPLLRVEPTRVTLWWVDEARTCVVGKNVTAELLGLAPDDSLDVGKARERLFEEAAKGDSVATASWEGKRGGMDEWVWPKSASRSSDLLSGIDGKERLSLGPHRFSLRGGDGRLLYKFAPNPMVAEKCVENTVRALRTTEGRLVLLARLSGSSGCDRDVGGDGANCDVVVEVGSDGTARERFRSEKGWEGSSDCYDADWYDMRFATARGSVRWKTAAADYTCVDGIRVACEGLKKGCSSDFCSVASEGVDAESATVWVSQNGMNVLLGRVEGERVEGMEYACSAKEEE